MGWLPVYWAGWAARRGRLRRRSAREPGDVYCASQMPAQRAEERRFTLTNATHATIQNR